VDVLDDDVERDVQSIRISRWGRVAAVDGVVPWLVLDPDGCPAEPIARFLRDFVARGHAAGSVRSYAHSLLRWWRFLQAVGVEWNCVTSVEVRDFVLWLLHTTKSVRRTTSATLAGTINPVTRKTHLDDHYQARTVRYSNAVLRSFYAYWSERGHAPLINRCHWPGVQAAGRTPITTALLTFPWVPFHDRVGRTPPLSRVSGLPQSETIKTGTACAQRGYGDGCLGSSTQ
jgi:hypothetical protein